MELTSAQLALLKTHIETSPDLSGFPMNSDGHYEIARRLNTLAAPDFVVYREVVDTTEISSTVSYVAVEAMTDINRAKLTTFYSMNPYQFIPKVDVRTYFANTFGGALGGAGQETRDALVALWKRKATRAEKLLASGTGTDATPADLGWYGELSLDDVEQIRSA